MYRTPLLPYVVIYSVNMSLYAVHILLYALYNPFYAVFSSFYAVHPLYNDGGSLFIIRRWVSPTIARTFEKNQETKDWFGYGFKTDWRWTELTGHIYHWWPITLPAASWTQTEQADRHFSHMT